MNNKKTNPIIAIISKFKNIFLIFISISLLLSIGVFSYVRQLETENCDCSQNWKRDFIKYVSLIYIVYNSILLVLLVSKSNLIVNFLTSKIIYLINSLLSLVYIILLIVYYFQIRQKLATCECSNDWKRHILIYPLIILILSILGTIIVNLISI